MACAPICSCMTSGSEDEERARLLVRRTYTHASRQYWNVSLSSKTVRLEQCSKSARLDSRHLDDVQSVFTHRELRFLSLDMNAKTIGTRSKPIEVLPRRDAIEDFVDQAKRQQPEK